MRGEAPMRRSRMNPQTESPRCAECAEDSCPSYAQTDRRGVPAVPRSGTLPDGTQIMTLADGTRIVTMPDGTKRVAASGVRPRVLAQTA